MAEATQQTLTGEEAQVGRTVPLTLLYCHDCGVRVLRSRARDHGLSPVPRWDNEFAYDAPKEATSDA